MVRPRLLRCCQTESIPVTQSDSEDRVPMYDRASRRSGFAAVNRLIPCLMSTMCEWVSMRRQWIIPWVGDDEYWEWTELPCWSDHQLGHLSKDLPSPDGRCSSRGLQMRLSPKHTDTGMILAQFSTNTIGRWVSPSQRGFEILLSCPNRSATEN